AVLGYTEASNNTIVYKESSYYVPTPASILENNINFYKKKLKENQKRNEQFVLSKQKKLKKLDFVNEKDSRMASENLFDVLSKNDLLFSKKATYEIFKDQLESKTGCRIFEERKAMGISVMSYDEVLDKMKGYGENGYFYFKPSQELKDIITVYQEKLSPNYELIKDQINTKLNTLDEREILGEEDIEMIRVNFLTKLKKENSILSVDYSWK